MIDKLIKKLTISALSLMIVVSSTLTWSPTLVRGDEATTPPVVLNGTVEPGTPGYLNAKSTIVTTETETKVNFRLTPSWGDGAASGVRVYIHLPSLKYDEASGEYVTVGRDEAPTPLGLQGQVSAGGGWSVIGESKSQGGVIVMEYDGDLRAGSNPAFDITLTTYNDGSDGVYGGVPEGTSFEINGWVSYEMFNRQPGTQWKTNEAQLDNESRVTLIASNLDWTTEIKSHLEPGEVDVVPIWERYQYVQYEYKINNISENLGSMIDGYTVTLDIDSTDSMVNGIIPFDLNRFSYVNGKAVPNTDPNNTVGKFVGVPGEGGILIYDITDWDGESELTDSIPYTYSGAGMIMFDQVTGDDRKAVSPPLLPGGVSERKYLISVPLSRQGFPSPPANFRVRAITNIEFAKGANWSKTAVAIREVTLPTYDMEQKHNREKADVVFGYETYFAIKDIKNTSNVPVFNPTVEYTVDKDYTLDFVEFILDEDKSFADFAELGVEYTYIDEETGDRVTRTIKNNPDNTPITLEVIDGKQIAKIDISEINNANGWDNKLTFHYNNERMEKNETNPVEIRIHGRPQRIGKMEHNSLLIYTEKIASNPDYNAPTTYDEVRHEVPVKQTINVIYPKEAVPQNKIVINGTGPSVTLETGSLQTTKSVNYGTRPVVEYSFGINTDAESGNTTFYGVVNPSATDVGLTDNIITISKDLFAVSEVTSIKYTKLDGTEVTVDLKTVDQTQDLVIEDGTILNLTIDTDRFQGAQASYVKVTGTLKKGTNITHTVNSTFRSYQIAPYDRNTTKLANGIINIVLPTELNPLTKVVGVYGTNRTETTTNIGYESDFHVEYSLSTQNVLSPNSTYTVKLGETSNPLGKLEMRGFKVHKEFFAGLESTTLTLVDRSGNTQEIEITDLTQDFIVTMDMITLTEEVEDIVLTNTNLKFSTMTVAVTVDYYGGIIMGSHQMVSAQFDGDQIEPREALTKSSVTANKIQVRESKTTVTIEGVNQIDKAAGVGNSYTEWVTRTYSPGLSYSKTDYTLDQTYKSLGGFVAEIVRPTNKVDNHNETVIVNTTFPTEQFDLYYVKIREEMKPYITTINIYRLVNGVETLWKTVDGSEWVYNTTEGNRFWRINTARPESDDLFGTYADTSVADHPYYKDPWDADVRPEAPVSRVEISMDFDRLSNDSTPQMGGTNNRVLEFMGRFHSTSVGKKGTTRIHAESLAGRIGHVTSRESSHTRDSLVGYSYAQATTGAADGTNIKSKTVLMGSTQEYLSGILNLEQASWAYNNGHGPDIYVPLYTEYDEFLQHRDIGFFHDKLHYEFTYPTNPLEDATYNFDARYFIFEDSTTLKYLTSVGVVTNNGETVSIPFAAGQTVKPRFDYEFGADELAIVADGDGSYTVKLKEGQQPKKVIALFEEIQGYGDNTTEVQGPSQDTLGSSLREIDVRIGGVVNGNKALIGKTEIFREPADSNTKTLLSSSTASFTGYTPKLSAVTGISFDRTKIYDYKADGITPNTNRVTLDIYNNSEADIKDVELRFNPDGHFRSRLLEIPASIFDGADYGLASLKVTVSGKAYTIPTDLFVLNTTTGNYELDLFGLFEDGTLPTTISKQTFGGNAELEVRHIANITAMFSPKHDNAKLWGTFSMELAKTEADKLAEESATEENPNPTPVYPDMPIRLVDGGTMFITGDYVDETANGSDWLSKPTFVSSSSNSGDGTLSSYTNFNVAATLTSWQSIWTSLGSGNQGANPTYTTKNINSPFLYNRVAVMNVTATHLNVDKTKVESGSVFFYDEDTGLHMPAQNIVAGDKVKVLYQLNNAGKLATGDLEPGQLPIFNPVAHIVVPTGMRLSQIELLNGDTVADANLNAIIEALPVVRKVIADDKVSIADAKGNEITDLTTAKRIDLNFETVLEFGESVFFYVEYTAHDDYNAGDYGTQNKPITWNVYGRPAFTHHYMSYDSHGVNAHYSGGSTDYASNFDGDGVSEVFGRVYNTAYRYANPSQLRTSLVFDKENVSGETVTTTVSNIINEVSHDNVKMELFLTLDTATVNGFELTEFPTPTYPADYVGEFDKPQLYYKDTTGAWKLVADFDATTENMVDINELKVDYGIVPQLHNSKDWEAPSFTVKGIGHWKSTTANAKSSTINFRSQLVYTAYNVDAETTKFQFTHDNSKVVWKAMPTVEFNLQSFDTQAEAQAPYVGSAIGKKDYVAGDVIWHKLTAKNHSTFQGLSTNTPYGKAPLLKPVIFDKIPEYIVTEFGRYVNNGVLDIKQAIADGVIEINFYDASGAERPFELPNVTVTNEKGLDVAGAQTFSNDLKNNGSGFLSSKQPNDTITNPANEIDFTVVKYSFDDEKLGRNETMEIIYKGVARDENLPFATYADGTPVWAPLNGWYGRQNPISTNQINQSMDMASLLHDAGISGDRGHEMTAAEFLSSSYSWVPGSETTRRQAANTPYHYNDTFYDLSANKELSHAVYLRETATNVLYTGFTSGNASENFAYSQAPRVNDGKVTHNDRILWAQDGMQLNRAWLYGASEMRPDTLRQTHGVDSANFYEHDGSLHHYDIYRYGYAPQRYDNYSYAVQLHEVFTMRLHAVNMGDRAIESGIEYLSILPIGITPYDKVGNIIGITATSAGADATDRMTYEVIQTPTNDKGYRAPAQSQEAGTYGDADRDEIPYVVRIKVAGELKGAFNNPTGTAGDKYQYVDMKVRVYNEVAPNASGLSVWHDELIVTTIEEEEYIASYDKNYGGFTYGPNLSNKDRYVNDAMKDGFEYGDTYYTTYYGTHLSYEPYGLYIRGLNAQNTTVEVDGKLAVATGDQIMMRKPTLRVWSRPVKQETGAYGNGIESFNVSLYEEFEISSIVENQQLEVLPEYNRVRSGYNVYSGDNLNDDIWIYAPQTIGGARGSYFEPRITMVLPYGISPILENGKAARKYNALAEIQNIDFTASINDITWKSTTVNRDITDLMNVSVEYKDVDGEMRYVLTFTAKNPETIDVAYGQSIVVTPKVKAIDTPVKDGAEGDYSIYDEIITYAGSDRPVFNPIVSGRYTTGSTPSTTERDNGYNTTVSSNGSTIHTNDEKRLDSTTAYGTNTGYLKISERLIKASEKVDNDTDNTYYEVKGETSIKAKRPSIKNNTSVLAREDMAEGEVTLVDPAGKFWYLTEVKNEVIKNNDPYIEYSSTGDLYHSRFLMTYFITDLVDLTGEIRIKLGSDVLTVKEFEKLGYTVEKLTVENESLGDTRHRVQFLVTTPADDETGARGALLHGDSFKFMFQAHLTSGYDDDTVSGQTTWHGDDLIVDSYVSLITNDTTLAVGNPLIADDMAIQSAGYMNYTKAQSDELSELDINDDGNMTTLYAHDTARIEIVKPQAEVRKNTTRPRVPYSNGLSGDSYFNSSDIIGYMITHAENTGSGLKELIVEDIIPYHESNDSSVELSSLPISTQLVSLTSGNWIIPQETIDLLTSDGVTVDEAFRVFVYVSTELGQDGYEHDGWKLLNPNGSSLDANEKFSFPDEEGRQIRKVRVAVRAMKPDTYLIPTGTKLAIDADDKLEGMQSVVETDPINAATSIFPESVIDNAIQINLRALSDAKSTLFIYNTAQVWGNYVADNFAKMDQSELRSYLTPSRPVINIFYEADYYRIDNKLPREERFGWSDITTIAPETSPHLKFKGEYVNASQDMWSREEDVLFSEDTLIDPFITFELPSVMDGIQPGALKYVPYEEIDITHPLHQDHRSEYSLVPEDSNQWTWKLVRADGSSSYLTHVDSYSGPAQGTDKNVISVWFEGVVYPGDSIVVEFIGEVNAYAPGADSNDLKSTTVITNNTGLLMPLTSQQNRSNTLGYTVDTYDYNKNGLSNDRFVLAERHMFEFETYDNFGKRKIAYTDLNKAGTFAPDASQASEGSIYSFSLEIDNSKEVDERPYPYPIIYDVLPFIGDTFVLDAGVNRGTTWTGQLMPETIKLVAEGSAAKEYVQGKDYTVYVGPFKQQNGKTVVADLLPQSTVATQEFYESLGTPEQTSAVRNANFVPLTSVINNPELMSQAKTILMLFNDPNEALVGRSKLKLTYSMKAPLNAPVLIEQNVSSEDFEKYTTWNSFAATQITDKFIPQESNKAGVYITQKSDKVNIGNYVWSDVNYNGIQDEGTMYRDDNGRWLVTPSKDLNNDGKIDDPGINGVKVQLRTAAGYPVDNAGNPIHNVNGAWYVVDEATGESALDDVFLLPIASEGPLTTVTQTDIHGNDGYYTFSNIPAGEYRVVFEFPQAYDKFSVTTETVFRNNKVEVYGPTESLSLPGGLAIDNSRLIAITAPAMVDTNSTDEERMSFDIGVGRQVTVGGTLFKESISTMDGIKQTSEPGVAGYKFYLKDLKGNHVLDNRGNPIYGLTDANGKYSVTFTPIEDNYYFDVKDTNDGFNYDLLVSPIVHTSNPFENALDNDGYTPKGVQSILTNAFATDVETLEAGNYDFSTLVGVGLYERQLTATIGNRVWHDLNRNGIQDLNEPGIAGQVLELEQYAQNADGSWTKTGFTKTTTSNADGYYYFTQVPILNITGTDADRTSTPFGYQVVVKSIPSGFTFTTVSSRNDIADKTNDNDNDFYMNGTLHEGAVGDNLIIIAEFDDNLGDYLAADNNTVDLGLVKHQLATLSGDVFIDKDGDGIKDENPTEAGKYQLSLQVLHNGAWINAIADANGIMVEPIDQAPADAQPIATFGNEYVFENLHMINRNTLEAYQYRVVAQGIELWNEITKLHAGNDDSVDNDFTLMNRGDYFDFVSETVTLTQGYEAEIVESKLIPFDTTRTNEVTHVDLGLHAQSQTTVIGDYLWYDNNKNGLQDSSEPGIENVVVKLYRVVPKFLGLLEELVEVKDADGNHITTTTDADGYYEFEVPIADYDSTSKEYNIPYEYVVAFERHASWSVTAENAGNDETIDSDFSNLRTSFLTSKYITNLSAQEKRHTLVARVANIVDVENGLAVYSTVRSDMDIDGGVVAHETVRIIGDTAYEDINNNGIQDPGEPGISGLTVNLYQYDSETQTWVAHTDEKGNASVVTDENGKYQFSVQVADMDRNSNTYLQVEQYKVVIEAPANYRLVEINSIFEYGQDVDPDEIVGIEIDRPYSYVVSETITLAEYSDEYTDEVDLLTARDYLTADAGFNIYAQQVVIGGVMWNDADADGIQDADEIAIPGETVTLWELVDSEWIVVEDLNGDSTQTTDAKGNYEFLVSPTNYDELEDNFLAPRKYRVTATREGYQQWSEPNVGTDTTIDSDIRNSVDVTDFADVTTHTGITHTFDIYDVFADGTVDVKSVRDDVEMDMGRTTYPDRVIIGGVMWEDANVNHIQDTDEKFTPDAIVTLWRLIDGEWTVVEDLQGNSTSITDANGVYSFVVAPTSYDQDANDYLLPYEYRVTAERDGNQLWSEVNQGDDITIDSDIRNSVNVIDFAETTTHTGITHSFNIADMLNEDIIDLRTVRNDVEMDMGIKTYRDRLIIAGHMWNDINEDGIQQPEETYIPNEEITLWKFIPTDWSDFSKGGEWTLVEDLRGNSMQITDGEGYYEFEVAPTSYDYTSEEYLMPYYYRVSANREGFERWSLPLQGDDATLDSDIYNASESPDFPLTAETVIEEPIVDDEPTENDTDDNLPTDELPTDENEDGTTPAEETPEVEDEGQPEIEEIAPEYSVNPEFEHTGITSTFTIFDLMTVNGQIDITTVRDDVEMDMGRKTYDNQVIIGGHVWIDANENGIREENETMVADKEVTLWRFFPTDWTDPSQGGEWKVVKDLNGDSIKVTDANGYYEYTVTPTDYDHNSIDYLRPYEYRVTMGREGNHEWTLYLQGEDTTVDSDVIEINRTSMAFINGLPTNFNASILGNYNIYDLNQYNRVEIASLRNDITQDAGFVIRYRQVALGDRVWNDANENGLQDAGEVGIKGVNVTLQRLNPETGKWETFEDLDGNSTLTTDANGQYVFYVEPVDFDEYSEFYLTDYQFRVLMEIPEGYRVTPATSDDDNTINNDYVEHNGTTLTSRVAKLVKLDENGNVVLSTIQDDMMIDFGLAIIPSVATGVNAKNSIQLMLAITVLTSAIFVIARKKKDEDQDKE